MFIWNYKIALITIHNFPDGYCFQIKCLDLNFSPSKSGKWTITNPSHVTSVLANTSISYLVITSWLETSTSVPQY